MPTNYTPIGLNTPATPDEFNARFEELDDAIEDVKSGTSAQASPQITSFANAQHDHTDAANGGKLPFDALDTTGATDGQVLQVQSGAVVAATIGVIPTGGFIPYGGATPPLGWLLCDGSAVSRATYASLFSIVGTTFGNGDGSTTFNLPDFRGRVLAGTDNMGGVDAGVISAAAAETLGGTYGSQTHTLTVAEMPAHNHDLEAAGGAGGGYPAIAGVGGGSEFFTNRIVNKGGGGAHNNVQPTIFVNWLIKT